MKQMEIKKAWLRFKKNAKKSEAAGKKTIGMRKRAHRMQTQAKRMHDSMSVLHSHAASVQYNPDVAIVKNDILSHLKAILIGDAEILRLRGHVLYEKAETLKQEANLLDQKWLHSFISSKKDFLLRVQEAYGPSTKVNWISSTKCVLENGDIYE